MGQRWEEVEVVQECFEASYPQRLLIQEGYQIYHPREHFEFLNHHLQAKEYFQKDRGCFRREQRRGLCWGRRNIAKWIKRSRGLWWWRYCKWIFCRRSIKRINSRAWWRRTFKRILTCRFFFYLTSFEFSNCFVISRWQVTKRIKWCRVLRWGRKSNILWSRGKRVSRFGSTVSAGTLRKSLEH